MKFKVGDKVTVTEPIEAYYSNYGGNPEVIIQPGMVGVVGAVKVPWVKINGYFNCVDFIVKDKVSGRYKNNVWRIAATDNQLKRVKN